ncbi:MAG: aldo/keto reductase, partial [Anaerolineae bacterium]|nr:aldo/keto reductase [Anaerolineae bacterium]
AGISNYTPDQTRQAIRILRDLGTPCIIHQASYSMVNRWIEHGLLELLSEEGVGCICFSPLAQGLLTNKYLGNTIPSDSRAAGPSNFLRPENITHDKLVKIKALNNIAKERGQTMAQMAIAWVLRHPQVTSALVGASKVSQIADCVKALDNLAFTPEELEKIESILST